jgi:hypothetical protein
VIHLHRSERSLYPRHEPSEQETTGHRQQDPER